MALVGVFVGGVIGFAGQALSAWFAKRDRVRSDALEAASAVLALSEDYRNRVWEERNGLSTTSLHEWDIKAHRLAQARLRLLVSDEDLLSKEQLLQETGEELGRAARLGADDDEAVAQAMTKHRVAIAEFTEATRRVLTHNGS